MRSRFFRALLVCAAIGGLLIHRADTVRAVSSGVVISQVYGGGGERPGADVQERLHRVVQPGNAPVSLPGCPCSTRPRLETSRRPRDNLPERDASAGTVLPRPGRRAAGAGARRSAHPGRVRHDLDGAATGKVALVNGTTPLGTAGCPTSGPRRSRRIRNWRNCCFEGTPTADPHQHGCRHPRRSRLHRHRQQQRDFATGTPAPRNTATPLAPCGGGDTAPSVSSTTPANGATNVSVNSTIVINFSESVTASASAFSLECPAGSPRTFTQTRVARHDVHADADLAAAGRHDVHREGDGESDHRHRHDRSARHDGVGLHLLLHDGESRRHGAVGDRHDARERGTECPGRLVHRHQLQRERDGEPHGVLDSVPGGRLRSRSGRALRRRPPSR